jgi:aminoglycoside phosphotransferase (APT) family kinase protein
MRQIAHWVVKQLDGSARREGAIYEALGRTSVNSMAPSLVAVEEYEGGALQLYLERVEPVDPWPWKDTTAAACVLRALARLHDSPGQELARSVRGWDYDVELQHRADQLLWQLEQQRAVLKSAGVDVRVPVIRRLARGLPEWRRQLLSDPELGQSVIHGDAHPGNVMLTRRASQDTPVLFDWERARVGSPLEDVSSWLQTLAFWEPEARRRHDTLLGEYLLARGSSSSPTRALRDMYWLAAASNCLAGSVLYHLSMATSTDVAGESKRTALAALRDQLRILRRADACWS